MNYLNKVIFILLALPILIVTFVIITPLVLNITRTEIFFDNDYSDSFKITVKENHKPSNFGDYFKIKFISTTSINHSENIIYCVTEKYFLFVNISIFKWNSYRYIYDSITKEIKGQLIDSQTCMINVG